MTAGSFVFRILDGLPPAGLPARRFTAGPKGTSSSDLVVEFQPDGGPPWFGYFQTGTVQNSAATMHPNGRDVVVIAGGLCYVVSPNDGALLSVFGGEIKGVWQMPKLNLLIFNGGDVAFAALGVEGWTWRTRRISWNGFEGIEIAEKTIYGRGWNAVARCWQPFSIEAATGVVHGGAYDEAQQQRIALAREMSLRVRPPLPRFVTRLAEIALGALAISLVLLSIYLIVDSVHRGELTWAKVRANWALTYLGLAITSVTLLFGIRLLVPSLAPRRRLISRKGIIAFFGIYVAMMLIMYFNAGVLPVAFLTGIALGIGRIATNKWFS